MYKITMLGIIEGGYRDVRGLEGTEAAKFTQNLRRLPHMVCLVQYHATIVHAYWAILRESYLAYL